MNNETSMNDEIGSRIRALRKSSFLTINKLSELLEITPGSLTCIESGRRGATVARLEKIGEIFHVSLDYLISGRGEAPVKWSGSQISYFESVLGEYERQILAKFAKAISVRGYSEKEINLLSEALDFQIRAIDSLKE